VLKLRWRRLCQVDGHGISNPPHIPGGEKKGVSPPTLTFFFRPWTKVMFSPTLTPETGWLVPEPGVVLPDDELLAQLDSFLGEVRQVVQVCVVEGGHDHVQLTALLDEALREALRVYSLVSIAAVAPATVLGVVAQLFDALATVTEKYDQLKLRSSSFAPDEKLAAPLPPQVSLDLPEQLRRQGHEGYLSYSEAYASVITARTAVQYLNSLRRESAAFHHLDHVAKRGTDMLHIALQQGFAPYADKAVLEEAKFPPIPSEFEGSGPDLTNQILVHWPTAEANEQNPLRDEGRAASAELAHWYVYLGPTETNAQPMIAKLKSVNKAQVRAQYDLFCEEVAFGRPATGFKTDFLRSRFRDLSKTLWGGRGETEAPLEALLLSTGMEDEETLGEVLDAPKVVELLSCLATLLKIQAASRTTHAALNAYLREVLAPAELLPDFVRSAEQSD
jgi:hypothetical protein